MPGIDASIPLGVKTPDATQNLSGLLNIANSAQQYRNQNISLSERQAVQGVLSNPQNYTDDQGNIDFTKAMPMVMQAAPTTGMKYVQDLMTAQQQHTEAQRSLNAMTTENRQAMGAALYALPPNAPADLVNQTFDQFEKLYKGSGPYIDTLRSTYNHAAQAGKGDDFIANAARTTLPQATQQQMATPEGVAFSTGAQSGVVSTKPGTNVPVGQQFAVTQNQVGPQGQEAVENDAQGNQFIVTRTPSGAIVGTRPLQSQNPQTPGPFRLPQGETSATMADLQGQRTTAQQTALAAPVMHDINRTIISEANKGLNTGALGALTQRVMSATGFQLNPGESATDYNVLGKMLERSALTAAQSMGPHTNAGLEASVRANGSLDYTPAALKKIAYLNDALVTGSQMYQQGLESAIQANPTQGVFAKRQFDQEWGKAATPQALRLKNAVDQGNQEEIQNIVKEVGGKGTKAAQALYANISRLRQLSGQ